MYDTWLMSGTKSAGSPRPITRREFYSHLSHLARQCRRPDEEPAMDWNAAIEKNRQALKRVLAMLVAMAGLGATSTSPLWGGRRSSDRRVGVFDGAQPPPDASRRPPHKGEVEVAPGPFLPRHLHRAVLALLRPAEAATRRLVIVAARGIIVALPPARPRKPKPASIFVRNGVGTGILRRRAPSRAAPSRTTARTLSLCLFDTLRPPRSRRPALQCVPRILAPGFSTPFPVAVRYPPSPRDPIDARRLLLRLQAVGRALDNLPAAAQRFARWRALTREAVQNKAATSSRRFGRVWPLKPGRPPGWRRKPDHEVHEILNVAHGLALWALERPDTS
jgi:hypothetical protein